MVSSGLVDRVDVSHYRLSIHLLIAFIILTLILWNYLKINIKQSNTDKIKYNLPLLFLLLIYIQIVIGAFVSGMDAGKIYNSWPLMGNNYFPDDNAIDDLFKLTAFDSPSLVQFIHRNLAYVILLFFLFILFDVYKNKLTNFYLPVNLVGFLLFLQIFLGIITLLYGAQILVSSMHQISSIFLVSSCVYLLYINKKFN